MPRSRDYPTRPFLGVSAVVQSDAGILLIERGKPPLMGSWSLPGGLVETGEQLEQAIIREMREETGIQFTPHHIADLVEIIRTDKDGKTERHYVIAVFYGTSDVVDLIAGDDASTAEWVPIENLADHPLTEGTLDVVKKILNTVERSFP
ncbi:MAG TPA: NUDIX hydrolase [Rhizobiales bacterium]|nr:NUDIX hydrolase [Hyphomicrobiales bacterium]